jgi:transposase
MLNTPSPSIAPARREAQPPARQAADMSQRLTPKVPRRRGAQPSNRNALTHGLYAAKNKTPLTGLLSSFANFWQILDKRPPAFSQAILEFQQKIVEAFQISEKIEDLRSILAWQKTLLKMINSVAQLKTVRFMQQRSFRDLFFVAQNAIALIRYDFRACGITRDADSFRVVSEKSDFNSLTFRGSLCAFRSDPPYPFITPRQWAVLEPLLPPSEPTGRRGRPPVDPRELLDAIFWKFAHHARWQDLPTGYPPVLSCRRYYRRLFLSGRLSTLYSALNKDLLSRGKADLSAFVNQGCFTMTGNKLSLRLDFDETWQMHTALLFFQQGFQVLRRFRREEEQDRRRRFPSFRNLSLKSLQDLPVNDPPLHNEPEFSYTPVYPAMFEKKKLQMKRSLAAFLSYPATWKYDEENPAGRQDCACD